MVERSRPAGSKGRAARDGTRFPSQVLGDNVCTIRKMHRLKQEDLSMRMAGLGHIGWSRVTVSDVERAQRGTSIDELFALAIALETSVVKLLDPWGIAGQQETGLDLSIKVPFHDEPGTLVDIDLPPNTARALIVPEGEPWKTRPAVHVRWEGNVPDGCHPPRSDR